MLTAAGRALAAAAIVLALPALVMADLPLAGDTAAGEVVFKQLQVV